MSVILLIEDDQFQAEIVRMRLEGEAYQVITAKAAEEGIRLAKERKPALILMDMVLPGMHGLDAIVKLKELPETKDIPIIALSAMSVPRFPDECLRAGAQSFIKKSGDPSLLLETIEKTIGKPKRVQTVLIITQELVFITSIIMNLMKHGYGIHVVAEGAGGVIQTKKIRPDLVLLDISLPDNTGRFAFDSLKKSAETKAIPVLLLASQLPPAELEKKASEWGAEDCLARPFETEEVLARVGRFLRPQPR